MTDATRRAGGVIFRVAAGPRCGFGHLVRCRSLADALGVEPRVSVRGTGATRAIATSSGWTVMSLDSETRLREVDPKLLIVDDPSSTATGVWVRRARRLGMPVATIHDLGRGYADSDVVVDGSIRARDRVARGEALLGPDFAILHPAFATLKRVRQPRSLRVLIALGGGVHVRQLASRLCLEIARRVPNVDIHVARGFVTGHRVPSLPAGRWVSAPHGLATELSQAMVAVVAGGVTLYEACALGVPVVGLAVTAAQHLTVRTMADRGVVLDGGAPPTSHKTIVRTADAVALLMGDRALCRRHSQAARSLVDGRGAFRVARRLRRMMSSAGTRGDKPSSCGDKPSGLSKSATTICGDKPLGLSRSVSHRKVTRAA